MRNASRDRASCPGCGAEDLRPVGRYPTRSEGLFRGLTLSDCAGCGLVSAQPLPTLARLDEYYRGAYWLGDVASINPVTEAYYLAQSLARLDFIGGKPRRVLDVGAGSGALARALQSRGFSGGYDAVEPDAAQVRRLAGWGLGAVARRLDELPAAAPYDLIVLSHVLEHMPEPRAFLSGLTRRLADGGRLFVEVPNQDQTYKTDLQGHLLFFAPATLRRLLEGSGRVAALRACGKTREALRAQFAREDAARGGWKRLLPAGLKAAARRLLGRDRPKPAELLRREFRLDAYSDGDELQWLRATVVKAS